MNRLEMLLDLKKEDPEDEFLEYAIALEYIKTDQHLTALKRLEGLVENKPNYLPSYYQLGKLYEEQQQTRSAIEIYKKGLRVADKKNDTKTKNELAEAIWLLEE